jgi:broad specificity phosphatase PhoE
MRRSWAALLVLLVLLSPPVSAQEVVEDPSEPMPPRQLALLDQLRSGGFVIYFRHAATDFSMLDSDLVNLSNCATQRNLSPAGRLQAVAIGEAIQALGIPIGEVLSSEFCRTQDTAMLAFGRVQPTSDLSSIVGLTIAEYDRRLNALRAMLASPPEPGTNTVLVAHQFNLRDAMGVSLGTEGEAAIYQPGGDGGTSLVVRLLPHQWAELAPL